MSLFNPLSWISGGLGVAAKAVLSPVFDWLGKREDASVANLKTKAGVAKHVAALEVENNKLRAQQYAMMFGWPPFRWLMLGMMATAVWHTAGVYFDSCAHLPVPGWWGDAWYPTFMPHVVGSWGYAKLPGDYAGQSFKIIAMLTGVQLTQSGIGALMTWLNRR